MFISISCYTILSNEHLLSCAALILLHNTMTLSSETKVLYIIYRGAGSCVRDCLRDKYHVLPIGHIIP